MRIAIKNPAMMHDIEILMLRILPPNLGFLTRQGGDFKDAKSMRQKDNRAESDNSESWSDKINRPSLIWKNEQAALLRAR